MDNEKMVLIFKNMLLAGMVLWFAKKAEDLAFKDGFNSGLAVGKFRGVELSEVSPIGKVEK